MARKEKFVRTGEKDTATGAEWVQIDVKVGDKKVDGKDVPNIVKAKRRLFSDTDQLGGLTDDYLLKCVNYAEDLLVRAATTRENTDATGKKQQRQQAMDAWKKADKPSFVQWFVEESHTEAESNAKLEAYYAEHLAE